MRDWYGRGRSLRLAVTTCCLMAFVLFGYDQGVFSGILQNEDWLRQFNHPSDSKTGIIVSCYNLGCFAGCISAFILELYVPGSPMRFPLLTSTDTTGSVNFFLVERLGRRKIMWLDMVLVSVGAILQASAYTVPHLVLGRM